MSDPLEKQGYFDLSVQYGRALYRWIKAGRPVRDEKEIVAIYEICKQCHALDTETSSCKYCGCRLNTNPNPIVNKIAMATEQCPIGKWSPEKM